jgi:hypothetical protein
MQSQAVVAAARQWDALIRPAVALLDALALERAVDAGWTSIGKRANPLTAAIRSVAEERPTEAWTLGWTPKLVLVAPSDNGST